MYLYTINDIIDEVYHRQYDEELEDLGERNPVIDIHRGKAFSVINL